MHTVSPSAQCTLKVCKTTYTQWKIHIQCTLYRPVHSVHWRYARQRAKRFVLDLLAKCVTSSARGPELQIQIRIGANTNTDWNKTDDCWRKSTKKKPNISILIFTLYVLFDICVFANVTIKYICSRFWTTRLRSTLASDDLTIVQQTMQLYSFICSLVTLPGLLHSKYNYIAMNREWDSLWIFVGEFGFWFFRQQIFFSLCCDRSLALNRIWKSFSKSKCHT